MKSKKTPEEIQEENKKLFQSKINRERRDFHRMGEVNKEKYMKKTKKICEWQIKGCREQILVLKGYLQIREYYYL